MKPSSIYKVAYDLRPAKQVERRMIIDAFQILTVSGFPIRDYQYVGFGSIYFVDFILFHKLLGIKKLLSIEGDTGITNRVRFNKPFDLIDIEMDRSSTVISKLDRDQQIILWLDYDYRLNNEIISDIISASNLLRSGSIILITVDARPPDDDDTPSEWKLYFEKEAGGFLDYDWTNENFTQTNLPRTESKILSNAIHTGLNWRKNIKFYQLFNFIYSDSCPMLTLGGLIGDDSDGRKIAALDFSSMPFLRTNINDSPFLIRVPKITKKERIYLDHNMPMKDGWKPRDFEIPNEDLVDYNSIYRYYPSYGEMLL